MMELIKKPGVLDEVASLNRRFLERGRSLLENTELRTLAEGDKKNRARKVDLGFNAFALVSDVYHRENFHSDVIQAILDPGGSHRQGDRYLRLFLELIWKSCGVPLRTDDYANAKVVRESGRIDILVYDDSSRRAIIIENKMNGAGDMNRQVVRYLEDVVDRRGYQCDAIVYLTFDIRKTPGTHGWKDEEKARVKPLLRSIVAFGEPANDLFDGWLTPCLDSTPGEEVAHVIRQYRNLILKLGQSAMNKPLMNDFYKLMLDAERHEAALSTIAMMSDLPVYRCQLLFEKYQNEGHPFAHLFLYRPTLAIFEGLGIEGGDRLKIDLGTWEGDHTKICFWNNEDEKGGTLPGSILADIGLIDAFSKKGGKWYARPFSFPVEEQALREFLDDFLQRLRDYVDSAKTAGI